MESKRNTLRQNCYNPLPLGSIKTRGWLEIQLRIQAEGLSGHIDEVWDDLGPDNMWLGGNKEGWERGPYYIDGLLPLAFTLDDEALQKKALVWVEAFLNSQSEEGWIGPERPEEDRYPSRDPWPLFVVMKVLTQYHEVSGDVRVIDVLAKFFAYLDKELDETPLFSWGKYRWGDLLLSIHWLFSRTGESWLLKLGEKIQQQGYDWKSHFMKFPYRRRDLSIKMETHVVNNAMGVKTPAVWYRQSGDDTDRQAVYDAIHNLHTFHGQVTGVFSGDEHLAGRNPTQGTELCAVVEYMFSLEQITAILGDTAFADRIEKIAFNALPATFTPDMCAHQYDQQVNQVLCSIADRDWTNGPDANIFGLEPNFGCCTANMHQGWPKYVSHMWMGTRDGGLAAVLYGPSRVTFRVKGGRQVEIVQETEYPFNGLIRFIIHSEESLPFPLELRIPSWAKGAAVTLPSGEKIAPKAGTFCRLMRVWNPGDVVELELPMDTKVERGYHGSAVITRGPLVYALPVEEEWKLVAGTPPFGDWEVYPLSSWNYCLVVDPHSPDDYIQVVERPVGMRPFSPEGAPVQIRVKGKYFADWHLEGSSAGVLPLSPVRCDGPEVELTLIPYGCTNLRVTEFPFSDFKDHEGGRNDGRE